MVLKMSAKLQHITDDRSVASACVCVCVCQERFGEKLVSGVFLDAAGHCGEQFQDRTVHMIRSSALLKYLSPDVAYKRI